MAKYGLLPLYCIPFILISIMGAHCSDAEDKHEYIVYMGSLPKGEYSPSSQHLSLMKTALDSSSSTNLITRNFKRSFDGFSVKLTPEEREKLAGMKGVVSVFPSTILHPQTTRSWDFTGFFNKIKHSKRVMKSETIIGVIDSGIWPESPSFDDTGFGPVPKHWKGVCAGGLDFTCNRKLIGARYYSSKVPATTARDGSGHGTHTASIAAGNAVKDVSFYGLARGTARGGVPSARIAVYRVCHLGFGCAGADILGAFDDAISDGVDLISISVGSADPARLTRDPIAIGAFHAMERGILTVHSAGNNGWYPQTTASAAPWLLSVAASTTDRRIADKVVLGDGRTLVGNAINLFTLNNTLFPLIYGKDASTNCSESEARSCIQNCLDSNLVKGTIVLCDQSYNYTEAMRAGAVGSIFRSDHPDDAFSPPRVAFPALSLTSQNYDQIRSYANSTRMPQANIRRSEAIKDYDAPVVASFSSRGPNPIISDIMKPDISAPGVNILAAFSPMVSPLLMKDEDKRSAMYNFLSGTSMACPHVTGAAAYVKMLHPDWSPSAIKSALMTTAWPMNATKNRDAEFAYGSGHLNPNQAASPGLVYEVCKQDYINMLCSLALDTEKLQQISGDPNITCPNNSETEGPYPKDLNYPSMTAAYKPNVPFNITFYRTAKNVGARNASYVAKIAPGPDLVVTVVPNVLSFNAKHERKSFVVTVAGQGVQAESQVSSSLVWSDGRHTVRSPIIVHSPGDPPELELLD